MIRIRCWVFLTMILSASLRAQENSTSQDSLKLLSSFLEKYPSFSMKGDISTFRPIPEVGKGELVVDSLNQSFCFHYQSNKKSFDSLIIKNELIERERNPKTGKLIAESKSKKLSQRLVFQALLSLKKMPKELLEITFQPKLIFKNKLNYLTLTPKMPLNDISEITLAFTPDPKPNTLSIKDNEGQDSFWKIVSFKKMSADDITKDKCWKP